MLIDSALQMEASQGNWPRAEALARELVKARARRTALRACPPSGITAFKAGRFTEAEATFQGRRHAPHRRADQRPGARLDTPGAGHGPTRRWPIIDAAKLPDWANTFIRYHRALLADLGGPHRGGASLLRPHLEERPAHPARRARLRAPCRQCRRRQAGAEHPQRALRAHQRRWAPLRAGPARARSRPGARPPLLVTSAAEGMAELFYGLGELLASEPVPDRRRPGHPASRPRFPAVLALSLAQRHVPLAGAGRRAGDGQALRRRHRRLRPHPQGHAA